ncbi:MAG: YdeI/OmpD-associated family protein [Acidobacteriia bacterium]|nr:YdeI/OmpD-associated family protein [Terriglobia bacterium]
MTKKYFRSSAEFRRWLTGHHATAGELWVIYYTKGSGKASMTWPESVDEALCFGWIDGIRKRVDELAYTIRFSPRKPRSIWSAVNIRRAQHLADRGLMQPAGLAAFQARTKKRSGIYSYEQRRVQLGEPYEGILRKNKAAWTFFQAQPPSYKKTVTWLVISPKKGETRLRRLEKLIADWARGRTGRERP